MKTLKEENLRSNKTSKAKLKDGKRAKGIECKSGKQLKKTKNIGKHKIKVQNKNNASCKSCTSHKLTGKGVSNNRSRGRSNNARRKVNLQKFRKDLNAVILSTFSALIPSCISYVT